MSQDIKIHWDKRYHDQTLVPPEPAHVLTENHHLLPKTGKALDLACGRGGNALLLAHSELETHAWDISSTAIAQLNQLARLQGLTIHSEARDIEAHPPTPNSYDIIVVSHYLERSLCPAISAALKPGGLLFYQTFSRETVSAGGPRNPLFRLATGELLELFSGLQPVVYRDEGHTGDPKNGFRNQAMLVAQKQSM